MATARVEARSSEYGKVDSSLFVTNADEYDAAPPPAAIYGAAPPVVDDYAAAPPPAQIYGDTLNGPEYDVVPPE